VRHGKQTTLTKPDRLAPVVEDLQKVANCSYHGQRSHVITAAEPEGDENHLSRKYRCVARFGGRVRWQKVEKGHRGDKYQEEVRGRQQRMARDN